MSAGRGLRRGESQLERQQEFRPRHISGEPGNDRGAKGVAERGSGQWGNRNRTRRRAIQPDAETAKVTIQFPSEPQ